MRKFISLFAMTVFLFAGSLSAHAQGILRDAETEAILREYTDPILEAAGLVPEDASIYIVQAPSLNAFATQGNIRFAH